MCIWYQNWSLLSKSFLQELSNPSVGTIFILCYNLIDSVPTWQRAKQEFADSGLPIIYNIGTVNIGTVKFILSLGNHITLLRRYHEDPDCADVGSCTDGRALFSG